MAKSIRSKHKRRMRAIKRVRYGKKELDQLKKTLGIIDNSVKSDVEIVDDNVLTFVLPEELKRQKAEEKKKTEENTGAIAPGESLIEDIEMTSDLRRAKRKKGSYPVWMNHRQIRKVAEGRAKEKKLRKKKRNKK